MLSNVNTGTFGVGWAATGPGKGLASPFHSRGCCSVLTSFQVCALEVPVKERKREVNLGRETVLVSMVLLIVL